MFRVLMFFVFVCISFSVFSQTLCDDVDSTENTRIYFVNGMFTQPAAREKATDLLERRVGNRQDYQYRHVTNSNEVIHEQLFEVVNQRLGAVDPLNFWTWFNNPTADSVPEEFKFALASEIEAASRRQHSNDPELRTMVSHFLQDLNAGKKVVLVSHSQGNFYANNAYNYIKSLYPVRARGLGVVAVATPASFVAGGGRYTQNSKDRIMFEIVDRFFNVVPPNVTINGNDFPNHSFIDTYMLRSSSKIVSDIRATINRLPQPEIHPDCDDRIAKITSWNAQDVSHNSARLVGNLTKGKDVDVWFSYSTRSSNVRCDGSNYDGKGSYSATQTVSRTLSNLSANTTYYYRACAKGTRDGVSDGGLKQFITARIPATISTWSAQDITRTHATLRGSLTSGIGVDVWFKYAVGSYSSMNCGNDYDGIGNYTSPTVVSERISGLQADTRYSYIACTKGRDGVVNKGSVRQFVTLSTPLVSCSGRTFQGDSRGLSVVYDIGNNRGTVNILFEAFSIPDGLRVFKHRTNQQLVSSGGLISGTATASFYADGSFDRVDVVVDGNDNRNTRWNLILNCPR